MSSPFVPHDLLLCPYYHGVMNASQAETMLKNQGFGRFLLRSDPNIDYERKNFVCTISYIYLDRYFKHEPCLFINEGDLTVHKVDLTNFANCHRRTGCYLQSLMTFPVNRTCPPTLKQLATSMYSQTTNNNMYFCNCFILTI